MNIECRKITKKEYLQLYESAEWFSPIQNDNFTNAIRCDVNKKISCVINYMVDTDILILGLTVWEKKNLSDILGTIIKEIYEIHKKAILIYLINKIDERYLKNSYCEFVLKGTQKKHLKVDGVYYDLYVYITVLNEGD